MMIFRALFLFLFIVPLLTQDNVITIDSVSSTYVFMEFRNYQRIILL